MPKSRRDVFAAISDPTRREILSLLADDALWSARFDRLWALKLKRLKSRVPSGR